MRQVSNLNVESMTPLEPPDAFLERFPVTEDMAELIAESREQIHRIMTGEDDRMLMLVGPCSIHDEKAGLEYAQRLAELARAVRDRILIVMRVYFEKPRTTLGWKGFINDPDLDGSFKMKEGLVRARQFLLSVIGLRLSVGTEWLDPITPQYLGDVITWGAIGARTVESQTHRQLASGLSSVIGYKNGTGGTGHSIQIAVDAMIAARAPHTFLSCDERGRVSIIKTLGNPHGHIVLRGGVQGPNYGPEHVADAIARLEKAGLPQYLMVDCSHGNSNKDHRNQPGVFRYVVDQRVAGKRHFAAVMLESHLYEGRQDLVNGGRPLAIPYDGDSVSMGWRPEDLGLQYGVSITDACIGLKETEELIRWAFHVLSASRAKTVSVHS